MAREISQRDLEDLGDERFEQLVASLVFAEHENAERPAAPDGGADVLVRPARCPGTRSSSCSRRHGLGAGPPPATRAERA